MKTTSIYDFAATLRRSHALPCCAKRHKAPRSRARPPPNGPKRRCTRICICICICLRALATPRPMSRACGQPGPHAARRCRGFRTQRRRAARAPTAPDTRVASSAGGGVTLGARRLLQPRAATLAQQRTLPLARLPPQATASSPASAHSRPPAPRNVPLSPAARCPPPRS